MKLLGIFLDYFFLQNLVLVFGLGLTPALRRGQGFRLQRQEFLAGGSLMLVGVLVSWGLQAIFVGLLGLVYLRTMLLIITFLGVLYGLRILIGRLFNIGGGLDPALVLPVNISCAAMGLMVLCSNQGFGIVEVLVAALGGVLGYGAAFFLFGEVLGRMELEWVPKPFRGLPLALICLGFVALVFMAISVLLIPGIR